MGGAGWESDVYSSKVCKVSSQVHIPLAGRKTVLKTDVPVLSPGLNPDGVLCVALEVGQGGTGYCCCDAHCVHHQRASLRLVVNSNKGSTDEHTLT